MNIKRFLDFKKLTKKKQTMILTSLFGLSIVAIATSIYFSQNAYFYGMEKVEQRENKVDTIYSSYSQILDKHGRKIPSTYDDREVNQNNVDPKMFYPNFFYEQKDSAIQDRVLDSLLKKYSNVDWIKKEIENNSLKKHPAAIYQYSTYVDNKTPAVKKLLKIDLSTPGDIVTGLFLPPGELLTINFPGMTDEEVKNLGLKLRFAEDSIAPGGVDKFRERWYRKIPLTNITVQIDKNNFTFGTPFGGLVNLESPHKRYYGNENKNIPVIIDNAVEAIHYVHGVTSESEWKRLLREAKAPVFDFRTDYIEFLGDLYELKKKYNGTENFPYPYKAMDWFRKTTANAYYAVNDNVNGTNPVRICFTNFVPIGEAVSYVRLFFVLSPLYWSTGILDYNSLVNEGSWGILHEFNHQNQSQGWGEKTWGFGGGGEVTNNTLTMSAYMDYTNVLGNRTEPNKVGDYHLKKMNGYIAQNEIHGVNTTQPNDFMYSVYMLTTGSKTYNDAIRSYYNSNILDYHNKPISIPNDLTTQNARWVYALSRASGYDWSSYYNSYGVFNYTDPVKNEFSLLETKLNDLEDIKPVFNFYASKVKTSNRNNFNEIGRPYMVEKNKKTIFKIEEYTNTNKDDLLENFQLTVNPKYGTISESRDQNNKLIYEYTPNKNNGQDFDFFEFSVDVTDKNKMNKQTTTFRVDLLFKDSGYQYKVPELSSYVNIVSKLQKIDLTSYFDTISTSDSQNEKYNNLILNDLPNNNNSDWEMENVTKEVNFQINFKQQVNINNFEIHSRRVWDYENPDNVLIQAYVNNQWIDVYNDAFIKNAVGSYLFNHQVTTDKLKIKFTSVANKLYRFKRFKIYSSINPNYLLTPDSNLINLKGDWRSGFNSGDVNNKTLFSRNVFSELNFSFFGKGFAINANLDNWYGSFDVYLDNRKIQTVSLDNPYRVEGKTVVSIAGLANTNHTVTIKHTTIKPIELSYFTVDGKAITPDYNNALYNFLTIGLPIIIIATIVSSIVLLYVFRNKIFNVKKESKNETK